MEDLHLPVLLPEVLAGLAPQPGESYLDLTAGYAGHAEKILAVTRNYKTTTLIDRDVNAVEFLRAKFQDQPVEIIHNDFCSSALLLTECGRTYDMILADFGVSSPQLDQGERGFSFAKAGPLDMRMDNRQDLTAAEIVNHWSESQLVQIFQEYGELSPGFSQKVAKLIVRGRPFLDTLQLAEAVKANSRHSRVHPATRVFQAIRIAVNDELGEIARTLPLIPRLLNPGGRVAFITFHSLEDRMVKDYLRQVSSLGQESELEIINKTPITAEQVELVINPRARSAKLRLAKKC